jgi:hypothetical protein
MPVNASVDPGRALGRIDRGGSPWRTLTSRGKGPWPALLQAVLLPPRGRESGPHRPLT